MAQHGLAGRFRHIAAGAELHRLGGGPPFDLGGQQNHRRRGGLGDEPGKPGEVALPRLTDIDQHEGGLRAGLRQG